MRNRIKNMIGIVSGLGPSAGLDLARKIIEQTISHRDQEHLATMLVSIPELVGNRTDFILKRNSSNPAEGIIFALDKLCLAGATVIGIPCNTSHAESIFGRVREHVDRQSMPLTLINMVDEVCDHIKRYQPDTKKVGVLSTTGTAAAGVYRRALEKIGRHTVELDPVRQEQLNEAIHNEIFGIKAQSNPVSAKVVSILEGCIRSLLERGAELGVLACTELPLAMANIADCRLPLLDANLVLARALVREVGPEKLKPWSLSTSPDAAAASYQEYPLEEGVVRVAVPGVEEVTS